MAVRKMMAKLPTSFQLRTLHWRGLGQMRLSCRKRLEGDTESDWRRLAVFIMIGKCFKTLRGGGGGRCEEKPVVFNYRTV